MAFWPAAWQPTVDDLHVGPFRLGEPRTTSPAASMTSQPFVSNQKPGASQRRLPPLQKKDSATPSTDPCFRTLDLDKLTPHTPLSLFLDWFAAHLPR